MTIQDLKNKIESKTISDTSFILKLQDKSSLFIAEQYISEILKIRELEIEVIDNIDMFLSANSNSIFGSAIDKSKLYLYKNISSDEIEIDPVQFNSTTNLIIVCSKIKADAWLADITIVIPKLEDWMLIDYAYSVLDSVDKKYIDKLLSLIKNPYRIINEIDKICIFDKQYQESILMRQLNNDAYNDVSNYDIFALSNAIIKKDKIKISELLEQIDRIDIDEMALYAILYGNFKNIILIQLDSTATAQKCGITDKQFWAIKKYNCGFYTRKQLLNIFKFLTSIDMMIKTGKITTDLLITYMIDTIIGIGEMTDEKDK